MKSKGKEHCQAHSMKPALHSSQNWTTTQNNKKRELHANLFNEQNAKILHKYWKTEFNSI
jgi:hypothetical protein